jgi:hypothetical protein
VNSVALETNSGVFCSSKIREEVRANAQKLMLSTERKKKELQQSELKSQPCVKGTGLPSSQMFGSCSKHENCLFLPAPQTPPRPGPWLFLQAWRQSKGNTLQAQETVRGSQGTLAGTAQVETD